MRNPDSALRPAGAPGRTLLEARRRSDRQALATREARRRHHEHRRQAQRMEAVGRLAGGLAHDFNNVLGVIIGFSELLLDRVPAEDPAHAWVGEISRAGERGAALTRQLLTFSRKQALAPRSLDLNQIVGDTRKLLQPLIGEDVELVTVLEPALGRVHADAGQVEQIVVSLAVHARDAMPYGGRLLIETARVELDGKSTGPGEAPTARPYVCMTVSDTGCGMDVDTLGPSFERFFTTRARRNRTGLDLATIASIVRQSGGHVEAESEPRRGTTCRIYLPRIEDATAAAPRSGSRPCPGGSGTALVAEDELTPGGPFRGGSSRSAESTPSS
jgi:two-component system cell cycle sensor histidine kinase/response regulator CckA